MWGFEGSVGNEGKWTARFCYGKVGVDQDEDEDTDTLGTLIQSSNARGFNMAVMERLCVSSAMILQLFERVKHTLDKFPNTAFPAASAPAKLW